MMLAAATPAQAAPLRCSADSTFDPVAASDVIVGGRIVSWERRADLDPVAVYGAVELHMEIAHVWKGVFGAGDEIVDPASLEEVPGSEPRWIGAAGACGAIDHDPTGMYAVLGLSRTEEGYLRTNRLTTFWLSPDPYDLEALSSPGRRQFRLPALGHGDGGEASGAYTALVVAVGALVLGSSALVAHRIAARRS
jgi:hypothetical protein